MVFFNSAVTPAERMWMYHSQPADADFRFNALQPKRDLMAELKQARDAYQLVVGREVMGIGFYEELAQHPKKESRQ